MTRRITNEERERLRARLDLADGGGCWRVLRFIAYVLLMPLIAMAIVVPLFKHTQLAWILGIAVALLLAYLGTIALRRNRVSRDHLVGEWNALIDRIENVDVVELDLANVYRVQDGALLESTTGEHLFVAPATLLPELRKHMTLSLAQETPLVVDAESDGEELEPKHEWPLGEQTVALDWYEEWRSVTPASTPAG